MVHHDNKTNTALLEPALNSTPKDNDANYCRIAWVAPTLRKGTTNSETAAFKYATSILYRQGKEANEDSVLDYLVAIQERTIHNPSLVYKNHAFHIYKGIISTEQTTTSFMQPATFVSGFFKIIF